MPDWIGLPGSVRLVGTANAPRLLYDGWANGAVRLRGIPSTIPPTREFVEIPASESALLALDFRLSRALMEPQRRKLIAYTAVQGFRADVERLAQGTRGIPVEQRGEPGQPPSAAEIEKRRSEARSRAAQQAGTANAKKRRDHAKLWRDWVADHAPDIRKMHPTLTQEDLADKLIAQATEEKVEIPERKTVVAHLSALERDGKLRKRTRSQS
jgi:type III secretion system FlhB-like substrate exporter